MHTRAPIPGFNSRQIEDMQTFNKTIGGLDTMSVVFGHEAYRDGIVGANSQQETRDAVIAHTKMVAG
jgi:hypothetical protein